MPDGVCERPSGGEYVDPGGNEELGRCCHGGYATGADAPKVAVGEADDGEANSD